MLQSLSLTIQCLDLSFVTNDEGDGSSPDEDKCGVQRDVGQFGQIVERVFLCPGPDPDSENSQPEQPEDDVEPEDDIFETAGHLTGVPDPPPPLLVLRVVARRHLRTPLSPGTLSYLYRILSTSAK